METKVKAPRATSAPRTRPAGIPGKKGRRGSAKKEADEAKAAGQSEKFATNQPPIKGMEDVDERIPELDDECQRFLSECDKRASAKQTADEHRQKIGELLKEHGLDLYKLNGKKFYIEPGTPQVKVVKLNQKG